MPALTLRAWALGFALLGAACTSPAVAQPYEDGREGPPLNSAAAYGVHFWYLDEPREDGTEAVIFYRNLNTPGGPQYLEWGFGEVAVALHVTRNAAGGCCPDTIEVLVWPPDLIVSPTVAEVPEGGTVEIRLMRWTGN